MKIRIKGNSIRYRLTKTEVEVFSKTGSFEDTTDFGNRKLTYALKAKTGIALLEAEFSGDCICLYLAKEHSEQWFNSDQVGFSHTFQTAHGTSLSLLLEKDFVCMDNTGEDQSDHYPNPNK